MFSYSPSDLIMFSKEVYLTVLSDFIIDHYTVSLFLLIMHLFAFLALIYFKDYRKKEQALFLLTILNISSWALIALTFFPSYFSTISWYWRWLSFLALFQSVLSMLTVFHKLPLSPDNRHLYKSIIGIVFVVLPLENLLLNPNGTPQSFFEWSVLKLAFISLFLNFILPVPKWLKLVLCLNPLFFVLHFSLIYAS